MSESLKLSFIGFGNMARALVAGAINAGVISGEQIMISSPRSRQNASALTFSVAKSNQHAAQGADVVFLATKPAQIPEVCREIGKALVLMEKKPLIVCLAAGVRTHTIQDYLSDKTMPVIRLMPNTPVAVGWGASGLYANPWVGEASRQFIITLMESTGVVVTVNNELDLDKITAISGSGPAYFLLMQEMLVKAAEKLGLSHDVATTLVQQTMLGTAMLTEKSDLGFEALRHAVTSRGGTTEAALDCFLEKGFEPLVDEAVHAAYERAKVLGAKSS
jgi:pyrroline-5-carboxylate reductase